MDKGLSTKCTILEVALNKVRKGGFEALSIGELAKTVGMSKSGLFAHFKSKESMQLMILDYAAENFVLKVFRPALKVESGLPRLRAIIDNWFEWSSHNKHGGCPLLAAAIEYDDRPGKVRDQVTEHLNLLTKAIEKSVKLCIEKGDFKESVDTSRMAFEIYSLILGFHIYERLLEASEAEKMLRESLEQLYIRAQIQP
jgi:AcrR family transcriptional regulator